MDIYSNFIHKFQELRNNQGVLQLVSKSINCGSSRQWDKRNDLWRSWKDMEENFMHITKWTHIWKGYILYYSNYKTFWKWQDYGDSKKTCFCQRLGRREPELPNFQMSKAGFRKGRRTRDQIANIRWIMEKAWEFQKNIYLCFINYTKAFDYMDHNKLWKALKEMGIPDHLTCLLRNLYADQEATS